MAQTRTKTTLSQSHPELAAQWHPIKNGSLTPEKVLAGSAKKAWWICPKGPDHEWEARVADRTSGSGCPCCAGLKVSVTNSFASLCPALVAQWHPTKNGSITPDQVIALSGKKYWWKCPKGEDHEWEVRVADRTSGSGCPYCAGRLASITNSLASLHPDVAAQWHPTKNGSFTPDGIVSGSNKKYWWRCPESEDHEWTCQVNSRTSQRTGCPFCAGQLASVTNSLASLYPNLAAQWHPTKNGSLTPDQVVARSHKKYWWKCSDGEDHEWDSAIDSRTRLGRGCPCCSGRKVSVTNSLTSVHPEVAAQWHPTKNGSITPDQVPAGSHTKYWWLCPEGPDHEWQITVGGRTSSGSGCPCCAGSRPATQKVLGHFPWQWWLWFAAWGGRADRYPPE